ncbi:uncharacterized protein LOC125657174 [Ostrea edulis]|uniref:uncharacterized protein LOC125657174 n=1 Tax=Ostrea edulis TaxID=37623 RepID=UPI0024AFD94D|nr:uncharacterized protein LOC125657174 [Ostrea edulis]
MTELLQVSDERKYKAIQENDNCLMATFEGMVLKSFLKEEDRVPKEIKEAVRNSIKDILLQGQTEFAPTDDEIQKRAKVIIKLIAASIKRQLSGNIRVRKHLLDEMAKMKALEKKRKVHEELLMTVQVTVSIEECKEALELAKVFVHVY